MGMSDNPQLSLVMPAYNEAGKIDSAVRRVEDVIRNMGMTYELIVVDDGSLDNTRLKAMNYARNNGHVKVVSYPRNIGKGFALRTGFSHASGDAVVFMDSDLDIDPKQVAQYVDALKYGDIIIASKWHPQSNVEIPVIRRILSHSFNVLVRLMTGVNLKDTQTGLKAVRRKALKDVFSRLVVKRYAYDVELLAMANLHGLKVKELPVDIRLHGLFNLKEAWRMFLDLLGIAYRLRIVKWNRRAKK